MKWQTFKFISFYFLTTRIILVFIGYMATEEFAYYGLIKNPYMVHHNNKLLSVWGTYDSTSYLRIAKSWYPYKAIEKEKTFMNLYRYFPIYPALMRGLHFLTGLSLFVSGLLISNLSLIAGACLLFYVVRHYYDDEIAKWSVIFLFLSPVSFIFSGIFTESLYLFLIAGCFYFIIGQKWWVAGLFAMLLTWCRAIGVFIIFPLMWEYFICLRKKNEKPGWNILHLLSVLLGVVLLLLHYKNYSGDPFIFIHNPEHVEVLRNPFINLFNGLTDSYFTFRFLACYTLITLLFWVIFYKHLRFSFHIITAYTFFVPLSYGLMSMPRMILSAFPFFILLASVSVKYRIQHFLMIALCLLQGYLFVCWCLGMGNVI